MLKTTVIENHVHHNLQSLGMSLIAKTLIVLVRTETRINFIIIGGGIAVVGGETVFAIGRVVLQNRGEPKSSDTKFIEVVEMLTDTIQVATMTERWFRAIFYVGVHAFNLLGVVSTLRKSVGHEHVKHIGIGESHVLVTAHGALFQLVWHLCLAKVQRHSAWLSIAQVHIDKQVVW